MYAKLLRHFISSCHISDGSIPNIATKLEAKGQANNGTCRNNVTCDGAN